LRQTRDNRRELTDLTPRDFSGPVEWMPMEKDGLRFSRATSRVASAWVLEADGHFEWLAFLDGVPGQIGLGESPSLLLARTSAEAAMRRYAGGETN
jgi:hypothetical protein